MVEKQIRAAAVRFLSQRTISKPLHDFFLRTKPSLPVGLLPDIDAARDANKLKLIVQAVCQLDNSFLSIQGPPGTGKTYTASHVILELLKQGKRIGINSNSHKAINNLMAAVAKLTVKEGLKVPMYKVQNNDDELFALYLIEPLKSSDIGDANLDNGGLLGATAWGFSNSGWEFDYLFVDEAGQVSIAYLVAMAH
jgi:superfamily I DNA and/or RNA helicase